jgi:mannan endo-1,4-beta-mannosidase
MKSRLIMLMALAVAGLSVVLGANRITYSMPSPPPARASLRPSLASYLGVYEKGSPPSLVPIQDFAAAAGREPNLAEIFSGWAEPFNSAFASTAYAKAITLLVQIDPTDASVAAIAAGDYDSYLRAYADSVRAFGHAVVIGFGQEMNAPWYSWGYGHVPAATFVAAWRHLVSLFRQQGAGNVTWLWTIAADTPGTGPIASWWPGDQYVTWVGLDGFYYLPSDTFDTLFGPTVDQVRSFTSKPMLLSETAVGPDAGQFAKIQDLFSGITTHRMLGLVWFDVDQDQGIYHQDWRIEDNQAAEYSFRLGVRETVVFAGRSRG